MRKPIQISTTTMTLGERGEEYQVLVTVALCDDGTIWTHSGDGLWYEMSAVPGTEEQEAEEWWDDSEDDFDDFPSEPGPFDYLEP